VIAQLGTLPFFDAEACPSNALEGLEPDRLEFEEATGNAGASFDRTYRRAALVLWPQARWLAVINQGGLPATLPKLADLAAQWQRSGETKHSALWNQAHELGGHMLRTWVYRTYPVRPDNQNEPVQSTERRPNSISQMLKLLLSLQDTAHLEHCITSICCQPEGCNSHDIPTLVQAFQALPPMGLEELLKRFITNYAADQPAARTREH
jgi:hypothetical protein